MTHTLRSSFYALVLVLVLLSSYPVLVARRRYDIPAYPHEIHDQKSTMAGLRMSVVVSATAFLLGASFPMLPYPARAHHAYLTSTR